MATNPNRRAADDDAMHRVAAGVVARLLSQSDGTVTALLERVTGESVEADVIVQAAIVSTAPGPLDVEPGRPVVRRHAIVRGTASRRDYLYAETLLVPDRLPADVPEVLAATSAPIGRVLADRGIRIARTVLGAPERRPTVARLAPGNAVSAAIFARRYRVDAGGVAVMLIDEWFLRDLSARVLAFG